MEAKVSLDTICVPSEDVVAREIEGEIVIIPLVSGIGDMEDELYTLNETGAFIWEQIDGKRTTRDLIDLLTQEYETDTETATKDVFDFIENMKEFLIIP